MTLCYDSPVWLTIYVPLLMTQMLMPAVFDLQFLTDLTRCIWLAILSRIVFFGAGALGTGKLR